jgi:hypothetical protein
MINHESGAFADGVVNRSIPVSIRANQRKAGARMIHISRYKVHQLITSIAIPTTKGSKAKTSMSTRKLGSPPGFNTDSAGKAGFT